MTDSSFRQELDQDLEHELEGVASGRAGEEQEGYNLGRLRLGSDRKFGMGQEYEWIVGERRQPQRSTKRIPSFEAWSVVLCYSQPLDT